MALTPASRYSVALRRQLRHGPALPFACAFSRSSDGRVPALRPFGLALVALLHRDESQSTAFSTGDWAIAVEWPERAGPDPDRLAFVPGDGVVYFVNSTEPRQIVAEGGVSPRAGGQQGESTLERKEGAGAQDWCR
jgi:hypothetical protein